MPTNTRLLAPIPQVLNAQRRIVTIATRILLYEHRLYEIQQSLPLGAAHLAMEEEAIPYTAASYLYVKLAQVQSQRLRRAALELLALSKTSDQDLALELGDLAMAKDDEGTEAEDLDRLRLAVLRDEMPSASGDSEREDDDQEA